MPKLASSIQLVVVIAAFGTGFLAAPSRAEDPPPPEAGTGIGGFVAAGAAVVPEYEGASDYEPVPLVLGQLDALGLRLEVEGLNARLNLLPEAPFQFGPAAGYRPGRDDVTDDSVDRLSAVDDAIEVGGFLRYRFDGLFDTADTLELGAEVLADVNGAHDGLTAALGVGYALPLGQRWRLALDTQATLASDDYMRTYFGIDAADAARSGLRVDDTDAGLKDVGVGVTLGYSFTERWGVLGRVAYTRLVGDAADSPIVDDAGTPDQVFGGLAVSFRF